MTDEAPFAPFMKAETLQIHIIANSGQISVITAALSEHLSVQFVQKRPKMIMKRLLFDSDQTHFPQLRFIS